MLDDAPVGRKQSDFSDYILNTYVAPDSKFPPALWADPDIESHRTTNSCESFHKHFGDSFYHAHPPVYLLMNRLEEVQTQIYVKLNAVRLGDARPIPRHRRMKLAEMSRLKREFETGVISRKTYISRLAWKTLPRT
ncbi:hypothetical protein ACOMHN_058594 [Nucella lapillus]